MSLGCELHSEAVTAASATWNAKPMQPQSWRRAWKTATWTKRLCGMTLPPSTASRGVASFISSLRASPASPGPTLGEGRESQTNGGYGTRYSEPFAMYDRQSYSWRTSQASFMEDSDTFSETWPKRGTMRNGMCFRRRKWAQATGGSESLFWGTPRVGNNGWNGNLRDSHRSRLEDRVVMWPTPDANTSTYSNGLMGPNLREKAAYWPTPAERDWRNGQASQDTMDHNARPLNEVAVNLWPTPSASVSQDGESPATWLKRREELKQKHINGNGAGMPLTIAASLHSHPAPTTSKDGHECSPKCRRLNPQFVEWLMGWPVEWSDAASGSGCLGMESYLSRQRTHLSALLRECEA